MITVPEKILEGNIMVCFSALSKKGKRQLSDYAYTLLLKESGVSDELFFRRLNLLNDDGKILALEYIELLIKSGGYTRPPRFKQKET